MPRFEHPIEYPFAAEAAAALGHAGKKLRKTLDALKEFDSGPESRRNPGVRADLVANAADAFWSYVVRREEFGLQQFVHTIVAKARLQGNGVIFSSESSGRTHGNRTPQRNTRLASS
jgi:hypothetical protein